MCDLVLLNVLVQPGTTHHMGQEAEIGRNPLNVLSRPCSLQYCIKPRTKRAYLPSFDASERTTLPFKKAIRLCAPSLRHHLPHSSWSSRNNFHAAKYALPTHHCFCAVPPPPLPPIVYHSATACCSSHRRNGEDTKARSPPTTAPAFHAQACLRVWKCVCTCIARLGKMLLYGLQGQQEGEHGEVLYDREGALFDALWELLLRFLVPYAAEAAR